jgi:hypothetical protein
MTRSSLTLRVICKKKEGDVFWQMFTFGTRIKIFRFIFVLNSMFTPGDAFIVMQFS